MGRKFEKISWWSLVKVCQDTTARAIDGFKSEGVRCPIISHATLSVTKKHVICYR